MQQQKTPKEVFFCCPAPAGLFMFPEPLLWLVIPCWGPVLVEGSLVHPGKTAAAAAKLCMPVKAPAPLHTQKTCTTFYHCTQGIPSCCFCCCEAKQLIWHQPVVPWDACP